MSGTRDMREIQSFAEEFAALHLEGFLDKRSRFDASVKALKAFFDEYPEATTFSTKSGLIKVSLSKRLQLDHASVRAILGDQLKEFQFEAKIKTLSFEPFAGQRP